MPIGNRCKMSTTMRALLALCFISVASARCVLDDDDKKLIIQDFASIVSGRPVVTTGKGYHYSVPPELVNFFLSTNVGADTLRMLDKQHPASVNSSYTYYFIIHGWLENRDKRWYENMRKAILHRSQDNAVIQVDWDEAAFQPYEISSNATRDVGEYVAEFILKLHKSSGVPLNKFVVIGHSLGGQAAGYAGKSLKRLSGHKLKRIIALDPAGPGFILKSKENRLNENDAEVVFVIHTNGGQFGYLDPCGTIDFYPNGGSQQPGCMNYHLHSIADINALLYCNHQRSLKYFIAALKNPDDYRATKCISYIYYLFKLCPNQKVSMGSLHTTATGRYYLQVNQIFRDDTLPYP